MFPHMVGHLQTGELSLHALLLEAMFADINCATRWRLPAQLSTPESLEEIQDFEQPAVVAVVDSKRLQLACEFTCIPDMAQVAAGKLASVRNTDGHPAVGLYAIPAGPLWTLLKHMAQLQAPQDA